MSIANSDTVIVDCPCGGALHFVSCAGPCDGSEYSLLNMPPIIAADIDGEFIYCGCGRRTTLMVQIFAQTKVEGP